MSDIVTELLSKRNGGAAMSLSPLKVAKVDKLKGQVFGWFSVVEKAGDLVVDHQGHIIEPEVLEAGVYDFVLKSRVQGEMHQEMGVGKLIESMMFTKEKQTLLGIDLGLVGWWGGFLITNDDVKKRVAAGDLPAFSIAGAGILTDA